METLVTITFFLLFTIHIKKKNKEPTQTINIKRIDLVPCRDFVKTEQVKLHK